MIKSALIIPQKEGCAGCRRNDIKGADDTLVLQIYFLTAGAGHGIVIKYEVEVIRFSPVRPERRLQVNNRKARYICV